MKFGLTSDIHITKKPYRLISALRLLQDTDILLVAGDLTDRGLPEQYDLLENIFNTYFPDKPIFIVSGNHDAPQNNELPYRSFEKSILGRNNCYSVENDMCGAYYATIAKNIDLIGLNPLYYQKLFRFPDRGEQLAFAERKLKESDCKNHIILCHPPLIGHNPLRTPDMQPYLPKEQDQRLQELLDSYSGILLLSGHTHVYPEIENDEVHGNIYINDGSLCPTQKKDSVERPYHGNVIQFELEEQLTNLQIRHL